MTTPEDFQNKRDEIVLTIRNKRSQILDDFFKAYLAENMKDILIKNLVLNEQQIDGKYRWWWSQKDEEYMK